MVAAASSLTQEVKGKSTGEAAALIQSRQSTERLTIATERRECVELAYEALINAISVYSDAARDEWHGDEALICTCFGVSETTIEREIKTGGLSAIAEVTKACNAGAGCRSCYPLIEEILQEVNGNW